MKGITKGKWAVDNRFKNENGVDVVSIGMLTDVSDIINAIHVFESEEGGTAENEAQLICTAGNLTNAGYNIEAMPQLVEALTNLQYQLENTIIKTATGDERKNLTELNIHALLAIKSAKNE